MLSSSVPIFKGVRDPFTLNLYWWIELVDACFVWKGLDERLRKFEDTDKIQYVFMPEEGTASAEFVLKRFIEEFDLKREVASCVYWSWKRFWSGTKKSYLLCFEAKGCPRILG